MTHTSDVKVYNIRPSITDIVQTRFFISLIVAELVFFVIFLNDFLAYQLLILLIIGSFLILVIFLRNHLTEKMELKPSSRELRFKGQDGTSKWKIIPKEGRIIHTLTTVDITYRYPNGNFARMEYQYELDFEVQDNTGGVKFHLFRLTKNKGNIHWMSQLTKLLAEEFELAANEVKNREARTETTEIKTRWLVLSARGSKSKWEQ